MEFKVTAKDPQGARRTFMRTAVSRDALMASLRADRWLVIGVEAMRQASTGADLPPPWHPSWIKPMTGFEVEMGLRQLASMLRSGITLLAALRTVSAQASSPRAKRTWAHIAERVFSGDSFAAALTKEGRRFDEIIIRLSEVGERSGELERTISRAADQLEARRELRTAVINALAYPVVAVLAAVGVSAYLVVGVIPKVAEFLSAGGASLPSLTQALVDISTWLTANGLLVLTWIAAAIVAWTLLRLSERGHELEDILLLRIPITGRILRLSGTSLFARSMQIMTESGVTLVDALDTGSRLMANRRFRRRVNAAHAGVISGLSLADALRPAVEFTPMLRRMAAVGEVSGSLPETFGETARFHEMLLALAVKRFGMLIEPVMIVVTGLIVGFVYIAFFTAIFAIAGAS